MLIKRLRVNGELGCDYRFKQGVNIFQGSNSTGKTSLLWFLDFIFGSSTRTDEFVSPIREKCNWVYVDLTINENDFTVKRNIQEPLDILVFDGNFETLRELNTHQPKTFRRKKSSSIDSITDFYFSNLGIQRGKVPISESRTAEFSWRNLMSLIYVQQDKWNGIQAQNNFQPEMKKYVFEIFMGLDDRNVTQLEEEKRDAIKAKEQSTQKLTVIKQILESLDKNVGSESNIQGITKEINGLESEKNLLIKSIEPKAESLYLINDKERIENELTEIDNQVNVRHIRLEELETLYNENELNLERNRFLLEAKKVFSDLRITKCPQCFNKIEDKGGENCFVCGQPYSNSENERSYAQNLFLFIDERKELSQVIVNAKDEIDTLNNKRQELVSSLSVIQQQIDRINKEIVSPIMQKTEIINSKIIDKSKSLGEAEKVRSLLNLENDILNMIAENSQKIESTEKAIAELNKGRVNTATGISNFKEIMSRILREQLSLEEQLSGFDELYTPLFESGKILFKAGREDINKSKGAKVILGYYTAVLEYSLAYGSPHPKLLILDTPRQDELDLTIFAQIFAYWNSLTNYGKPFQIITTGSEFPPNSGHILGEFHNQKASKDYFLPDKFSVYPINLE
jgi:hypothetical protein